MRKQRKSPCALAVQRTQRPADFVHLLLGSIGRSPEAKFYRFTDSQRLSLTAITTREILLFGYCYSKGGYS
jgi:hypothetical protein